MKTKHTLIAFAALATPLFADDAAELAKKLSNPVASLISVPFQFNYDERIGPLDQGYRFTLNVQPVIPIALNQDWNLIIRTIVPVISQHDVFYRGEPKFPGIPNDTLKQIPPSLRGQAEHAARKAFDRAVKQNPHDRSQDGLGDIVQSFFFSPAKPVGGWILAVGPVMLYPSASDDLLGGQKWGTGFTALALKQQAGWTYGVLANHIWSVEGESTRADISTTFVQPFVSYTTKKQTTFGLNAESTYDWNNSQWTVPMNATVSQLVKIGGMPVQLSFGGRYYVEGPSGAPEWGLRAGVTLLFPTGSKPADSGLKK
jgi:hypothetical protein